MVRESETGKGRTKVAGSLRMKTRLRKTFYGLITVLFPAPPGRRNIKIAERNEAEMAWFQFFVADTTATYLNPSWHIVLPEWSKLALIVRWLTQ